MMMTYKKKAYDDMDEYKGETASNMGGKNKKVTTKLNNEFL